ncbi:MAG: trehalose-phosphatase [Nitrospirota bacterium]|nr:trehalose-phosphatase [Nitrospirota bacterium]
MRRRSLRARLADGPPYRLLLFLDYDGTLTPIVRRPDEARLTGSVRRLLRLLVRSMPVVVVSGRALADLQRRVLVPELRYVACHGLLYKEPGAAVRWLGRRVSRKEVRRWARALEMAAMEIPGALVEDKGLSVALHDRTVGRTDRGRLRRRALRALAPWIRRGAVTLVRGKCVLEVRPAGSWNKGAAVARLLKEGWARRRLPVYFGDDRTDFDAFRVLRGSGVAVRVGGRRGVAGENAWVRSPEAVSSLLRWLQQRAEAGKPQA